MSDEPTFRGLPEPQGLYDPRHEHDACGIGFVANISGEKSHDIILKGIEILINLTHRGACGCDPQTGDGAGVLIQIPHAFFEGECSRLGFPLPSPGEYGVGMVFLPVEPHERMSCEAILEEIVRDEGLTVLGWRDTPVNANTIGRLARSTQPYIEQVFVKRAYGMDEDALERKLYVIRKRAEKEVSRTESAGEELLLHSLALLPDDCLQRPSAGAADCQLLSGAVEFRSAEWPLSGPPALFHQHFPHLASGPSLPLHLPQRRNQHPARQCELDAGAHFRAGLAALRRRHQEA